MGRLVATGAKWLAARVRAAATAWEQFWFTPADPIVLGVMRILVGGMLFYTHIVWGLNLPAFFGDTGWMSSALMEVFQRGQLIFSFWWYVPEAWHFAAHVVCLSVIFLFWMGVCTRVTSVMSLIISISYSYRAQFANYGLDQINTILTFYLAIGPSGAALSVDRLIQRYREARRALSVKRRPTFERSPRVTAGLAMRLGQIHFCVIYFYAGVAKLQGAAWWNGEAMWRAFANLEYQSTDMTWLTWYPWIINLMTHTTILWELSFPFLVWNRTLRPLILAMGVCMHFGIGAFMGMWTFGLIMTFGYLSFVPPDLMRRVLQKVSRHKPIRRAADVANAACLRRAAWRLAFDGANRIQVAFDSSDAASEQPAITIDEQFIAAVVQKPTAVAPQSRLGNKTPHRTLPDTDSELDAATAPGITVTDHKPNGQSVPKAAPPAKSSRRPREGTIIKEQSAKTTKPNSAALPVARPISMRLSGRRCVLCLERDAVNQVRLFRYFTSRGFRCLLSVEPDDAVEQAAEAAPDALLIMGTQLNDAEIETLHAQLKESETAASIVYVLRRDQQQRVAEWLASDHTVVLGAAPSLGETRRAIEQLLSLQKSSCIGVSQ